jgi:hypothetical protein
MKKTIGQKRKERQKKSKAKVLKKRDYIREKAAKERQEEREEWEVNKKIRKLEMGKHCNFLDKNVEELEEIKKKEEEEEKLKQQARENFLRAAPPKKKKERASADVSFTPNLPPPEENTIE